MSLEEVKKLQHENEQLKLAMHYALSGFNLAYEAISKNFNDEAMLHIGHHAAALNNKLTTGVMDYSHVIKRETK